MATTAASAAKAEGLVPYDGLLSKGGFWTILSYLPPAALIAALVAGHTDYDLTWWYVLASVGGFLVLIILVFVLMFFLGEYDWQIWALQHPGNLITRIWFTLLTPIQARAWERRWGGSDTCLVSMQSVGALAPGPGRAEAVAYAAAARAAPAHFPSSRAGGVLWL